MDLKRLACKLGWHDWYVIKRVPESKIDREVANEIDPLTPGTDRAYVESWSMRSSKECLRCGKSIDQIAAYRAARRERMLLVAAKIGVSAVRPKKVRMPPVPPPPPSRQNS